MGLSQTRPLDEEEKEEEEKEGKAGKGGKEDKDTGHLKGNPDSQFPQGSRQCLDMILSGTLRMARINGTVSASSTALLRV
jgi:hypothetical protein